MKNVRYTMKIKEFERAKLNEARVVLGEMSEVDDERARDEIIRLVFNDEEANQFAFEDINRMVEKVFLKTRRRLGIIHPLITDTEVTEIMVNGPKKIFYEKGGRIYQYGLTFDSAEELEDIMQTIAGDVHREINEMNPIVDARLKDGSRVSGVYKNVAVNGPILTIRKFSDSFITMGDMIDSGTITEEAADVLSVLVTCGYNMFISGGTSSGKTTFLNALSEFIPTEERVIVIEDSMELKLNHIENIVHMEVRNANSRGKGKVSMSELIRASLRMRPNRVIVGEVRGEEVLEMLSAMNTGHLGSVSTGHGNSVSGMLKRLETMYLMAMPLSVDAIRSQIAEGIDIMIHLERQTDGSRRVVEITELVGYEEGTFRLNPLFRMGMSKKLECVEDAELINSDRIRLKGKEYVDRLQKYKLIDGGKA